MRIANRRNAQILLFIILWVLIVLSGYYYFHKPVSPDMLAAPLRALLDLLIVALFTLFCGGLGRRLLPLETLPPLTRTAVQYSLGAGLTGFVWFLFSILGILKLPLAILLLIAGRLLIYSDILGWLGGLRSLSRVWKGTGGLEKWLAGAALVMALFQLVVALAPPLKWDALTYHLQLPRQYLNAGRLIFVPENPYWGHPQIVEMLYTFAMGTHRAETAALLGWSAGMMFLVGLFGLTNAQLARIRRESVGSSAGWMAVIAVLAGFTFRWLLGWAYSDLFSALFGLSAMALFFEYLEQRRADHLLWCALFCGMALGTKWTSGVLLLAVALYLFANRKSAPTLRDALAAAGVVFLAVFPWLARNLVVTGSPIYPYFFGTQWFDAARIASANQPNENIQWWLHLLLPFSSTWAGVDSAPGFSADIGPLLLLFALPGYLVYWRFAQTKFMALLLGVTALGLGVASLRLEHLMQTRLYFAALPALAIPCGWGWHWLQRQVLEGVRMRRIFGAAAALVIALAFWQDSYALTRMAPLSVTLGSHTSQQHLERNLGAAALAMQELETLPPGARTLFLWEPRGLYAPLNTQADLWIDRWRTDRRETGSAERILQQWKEQGFTHLLIYQQGVALIRPADGQPPSEDWTVFQELMALLPPPQQTAGDYYAIYAIP